MKIHIYTLGCKVNQFESQAMESLLREHGHTVSDDSSCCDAIILNTCAVTAESVRKSRQALRRLISENPNAVVGVCGCWSQLDPDAPKDLGANIVFGSGNHIEFLQSLENAALNKPHTSDVSPALKRRKFELLPSGSSSSRTRALLKVEDGCTNFCSYCIIPYTRGPVRSMPIENAVSEAQKLAAQGYREIVLTGIEIASYGRDLNGRPELGDLICAVSAAAPSCRIRLGSLEPRIINSDFCSKISSCSNLCPHFHLSLQSGCDATLQRMNRKYSTELFYNAVNLLRSYYPSCGITTDLIVGFPGETEDEFQETLAFIEKCAFSSMHIFPYSVRSGTAAAKMNNQVEKKEKHSRARRATTVAKKCRQNFLASLIGSTEKVLFEREIDGMWEGHAENYVLVAATGENLRNSIRNVQIYGCQDGLLLGNITL